MSRGDLLSYICAQYIHIYSESIILFSQPYHFIPTASRTQTQDARGKGYAAAWHLYNGLNARFPAQPRRQRAMCEERFLASRANL